MTPLLFGAICILIIIFLIFMILSTIYQFKLNTCQSNPTPWCYADWVCDNGSGGTINLKAQFEKYQEDCRIGEDGEPTWSTCQGNSKWGSIDETN